MTTEEKIKIMQAFVDGKEIEFALQGDLSQWMLTETPRWNWAYCTYRIKPEPKNPKVRPFKNIDEAFQATKERGDQIRRKDGITSRTCPKYMVLTSFNDYDGLINGYGIKTLFEFYTFFDGTPFGVEEGGEK